MPSTTWQSSSTPPQLVAGSVHLWRARPSELLAQLDHLTTLLTADEQQRAARFQFESGRHQFIVGRALLRWLLGHALNISPTSVPLTATELGRLELERGRESFSPIPKATGPQADAGEKDSRPRLSFNVSHSGDVVLVAIGRDLTVGVDVEKVRKLERFRELANHYYSTQECRKLFSLPEETQQAAFFHAWTRKEAILKATGKGLSIPLAEVEVSLVPGEAAEVLSYGTASGSDAPWRLMHVDAGEPYIAALAVDGYPDPLCLLQYAGEHPAS